MIFFKMWKVAVIAVSIVLVGYALESNGSHSGIDDPTDYAWILGDDHASVEIGSQEGPDNSFFGSIDNVLVQDTIVHVLDGERMQLSASTFSGRRLAEIGSEGQGPDEFMGPNALIEGNEGRVVVHDRIGALKHFELVSGPSEQRYRLSNSQGFFRNLSDLCRAGDDLFMYPLNQPGAPTTQGEGDQYLLTKVPFTFDDPDAELSHFGARPSFMEDVPEQFRYSVSRGTIHCTAHDHVLASHLLNNVVDIYDHSGQELGIIHFESLQAPTLEIVRHDGRDWSSILLQDAYRISNMVSLDARQVLLQLTYYPEDWSGRDFNRRLKQHTYVIDAIEQEVTFLGTTEKVFHHVTDSQYVASTELPQPLVHIGSRQ